MHLPDITSTPFPATRAEYRAQQETARIDMVVHRQAARPVEMSGHLWPERKTTVGSIIKAACADWERRWPMQASTMEQIAAHEAGHSVAYHATGMGAAMAWVGGSLFGRGGWSGVAGAMERPLTLPATNRFPPAAHDAFAEAVSCVAGPANGHRFGGHLYNSSGEVIETCVLAQKLAEMEGTGFKQALVKVLTRTVALLDRYERITGSVADALVRHKELTFYNKRDAKLLVGVSPYFLTAPCRCDPDRVSELAALFVGAPIDLPALMRDIAPGMRL